MDRVGGFIAYRELCSDARAYDDVVLVMNAEAEAQRILQLKQKAEARR